VIFWAAMATRRWVALMLVGLLAFGSCDGDASPPCCTGQVTSCGGCAADGGACEDAGAPEARTTYYSNDPRLEACRYPQAAK
jgi:hypothetical protein